MARKARSAVSSSPPFSSLPAGLVERLKVVSAELGQALTDDFSEVTQFCRTLEAILRHLQKGRGCTGVRACVTVHVRACVRVCTCVGMCVYTTFVCSIFIFAVSVFECTFLCPPIPPLPSLPPSPPSLPLPPLPPPDKVSFWGERRDYWHYLSEEVGGVKSLGGITKQVQAIPQVIREGGREGQALCCQLARLLT